MFLTNTNKLYPALIFFKNFKNRVLKRCFIVLVFVL
ncbi:hypothetical protein N203_00065 [Helicobacter pylori UM084]|nr:hypothetical protein N203_00065 [Helicobacter pylori UM084]